MKPFCFQQYSILQNKNVFRVGTDGVLLGALCTVSGFSKILEVGTGTGLIALMIAQRNDSAKIYAIDVHRESAHLAAKNFANAPFSKRLIASQNDFKKYLPEEKFDLIVSNPPYFEENQSVKDVIARQKRDLNFTELIKKSLELLQINGVLSVIIPSDSSNEFIQTCLKNQLHLIRKINIFGIENGTLKRNILEFSSSPKKLVEEVFVIEKSPRKYSDQYLELTKEFHVFGKN